MSNHMQDYYYCQVLEELGIEKVICSNPNLGAILYHKDNDDSWTSQFIFKTCGFDKHYKTDDLTSMTNPLKLELGSGKITFDLISDSCLMIHVPEATKGLTYVCDFCVKDGEINLEENSGVFLNNTVHARWDGKDFVVFHGMKLVGVVFNVRHSDAAVFKPAEGDRSVKSVSYGWVLPLTGIRKRMESKSYILASKQRAETVSHSFPNAISFITQAVRRIDNGKSSIQIRTIIIPPPPHMQILC